MNIDYHAKLDQPKSDFSEVSNSAYHFSTAYLGKKIVACMKSLFEAPAEASGFALAFLISKIVFPPLSYPLGGIAFGLLTSRLVIKLVTNYNYISLIHLTEKAYEINKKHSKIQLVSFLVALATSFLLRSLSAVLGCALGIYGGLVLDIETYKLKLQTERMKEKTII